MPSFWVDGERVTYKVRRGKGTRNIYIAVDGNLDFEVVLPKRSNSDPRRILQEKKTWLRKKLEEISHLREFRGESSVLYRGRMYKVRKRRSKSKRPKVEVVNGMIKVHYPEDSDPRDVLERWLIRQAHKYIEKNLPEYAEAMDVKYGRVFVRDSKSRWGSCSTQKNLNFNWRIICLPKKVADYLIVHELAHLKVFSHSKRFWKTVDSVMPDRPKREDALRKYVSSMDMIPKQIC